MVDSRTYLHILPPSEGLFLQIISQNFPLLTQMSSRDPLLDDVVSFVTDESGVDLTPSLDTGIEWEILCPITKEMKRTASTTCKFSRIAMVCDSLGTCERKLSLLNHFRGNCR